MMEPMASVLPPWLRSLRQTEIVQPVQRDPRSRGGTLLGLSMDEAKSATDWGQADFDTPCRGLSPSDLALLYAYILQLRHLEELTSAFGQILADHHFDHKPVVLDLGCGPCTGWFALAAILDSETPFEYIGIDRSVAMRDLGERLVSVAARCSRFAENRYQLRAEIADVEWTRPPKWQTIIVVISFLFASRSLDPEQLTADLNALIERIGRGSVAIVYTNSAKPGPNRKFGDFVDHLKQSGFTLVTEDTGQVVSDRSDKLFKLRYALLYRSRQDILERKAAK